jgi:hypothetical protein
MLIANSSFNKNQALIKGGAINYDCNKDNYDCILEIRGSN